MGVVAWNITLPVVPDRAFAAIPASLPRWGVSRFDLDARPSRVFGNTVVSSVNRGAADLSLGGSPVVLTAGYPALSPAMSGVPGIGGIAPINGHAAESAVPDIDVYMESLDAALWAIRPHRIWLLLLG